MSIAVAHSDSTAGSAALLAGAEWAHLNGTDLLVLHVEGDTAAETRQTGASEVTQQEVERDASEVLGAAPHEVSWRVVSTTSGGDVAGALLDLVAEYDAQVLVIGSRRRSRVGKLLLGSTVQRVLLDCAVPVLVVKTS